MGRLAQTTTITIEGQPHTLLLDMNAMVAFEEETKENFFDYAKRVSQAGPTYMPSIKELRALLWCELLHENNPDLDTPEKVGKYISLRDLGTIIGATRGATIKAAPEHKEGDKDPNPTTDLQTG